MMQEFIVSVLSAALLGAVGGGIADYTQGDDVLKSVKGGVAAGIALAITGWLMTLWNLLLQPY